MGFVSANQVTIGHAAASREDALHYLSEQSVELGFADDASAVEAAFIARENEAETGLVAGFAPSGRVHACDDHDAGLPAGFMEYGVMAAFAWRIPADEAQAATP